MAKIKTLWNKESCRLLWERISSSNKKLSPLRRYNNRVTFNDIVIKQGAYQQPFFSMN